MSVDIQHILDGWPYKPGEVNVRRLIGDDGLEHIQLRLDLGLLQMRTAGRPDGQRPHGHDSLLSYYQSLLDRHRRQFGSDEGFGLDEDACEQLRSEGVMFYHRYLAEFVLGDYDAVERDTRRNLVMFDLCEAHAVREEDRQVAQQYRPYVLMMYARARTRQAMQSDDFPAALRAVDEAVEQIASAYESLGGSEAIEISPELAVLRALRREVESLQPVDPMTQLREDLQAAIEEERYEDAAVLRDRLRQVE